MHRQNPPNHNLQDAQHSPTHQQLSPLAVSQHQTWDDFLNRPNHKANIRTHQNHHAPTGISHKPYQQTRRVDGKQHVEPLAVFGTAIGGNSSSRHQGIASPPNPTISPIGLSPSLKRVQPLPEIQQQCMMAGNQAVKPSMPLDPSGSITADIIQDPLNLNGRKLIFVLGGPGSGKGTNCAQLSTEFHLDHLSAGDLLREEVRRGSKDLERIMAEGQLVPMSITINLLRKGITSTQSTNPTSCGILIDGFPREIEQALAFESATACTPDLVLYFHCPLDVLEQRLLKRGESSGRADDNLDSIKKRFNTFQSQSVPVIDHYRKLNKVIEISAVLQMDTVYAITRHLVLKQVPDWQPKPGVNTLGRPLIFVLGGPGSGKGTMCAKIKELYTLAHLSVGDLLRTEAASDTPTGQLITNTMREGKIVSIEITVDLVKRAVDSVDTSYCGILVDGFPREMAQAIEWERRICIPDLVLFYECPLEILEKRLLERGVTSGRADDNLESIKKRFSTFNTQSMPVVEYYKAIGKVAWVSSDMPVSQVLDSTRQVLDSTPWSELGKVQLKSLAFQNVVFVLGGPGCGKGTQSDKIVEKMHYLHLSTGDLLRAEVKNNTPIGKQADAIMKDGGMVPIDVIRTLLLNAMRKDLNAPGYLIDGYPRTLEQAQDIVMIIPPRFVLYYECAPDILTERLLKRGESSGRADDNLESIKTRIEVFHSTTMPVIEMMESRGVLRKIDATRSMDEITLETLAVFS